MKNSVLTQSGYPSVGDITSLILANTSLQMVRGRQGGQHLPCGGMTVHTGLHALSAQQRAVTKSDTQASLSSSGKWS